MAAKAYYKALANIGKREKKIKGYGQGVGLLGAGLQMGLSAMGEKKQAWEDVEAGIGIGKEAGLTFDTEGMIPEEGPGGWFKRRFTSPKGTITGTDAKGISKQYGVSGFEEIGKGGRGMGYVGGIYDTKWDVFRDKLWDGSSNMSPEQVVGSDITKIKEGNGSVETQFKEVIESVKPNAPLYTGTFSESFGEARKSLGPDAVFSWENPETKKTDIFTTKWKGE